MGLRIESFFYFPIIWDLTKTFKVSNPKASAMDKFFHGEHQLLLYTEMLVIKGVKPLIDNLPFLFRKNFGMIPTKTHMHVP